MQDVIFTINPQAASGRAGRVWAELRKQSAILQQARCIMEASPGEARQALLDQLDERVRRVIVIGGDGTVNSTASTLLESGHPAALGLIPVGSGSDAARGLGLEHHPAHALERALNRAPRVIDALHFSQPDQDGWVINIASTGVSGLVAREVGALDKRWAGTYLWTALKSLVRYTPADYRIHLDEKLWFEGPLLLCAIANGTSFARGMRIAPNAMPDDGLADVVLVKATPFRRVLPWVPRLYTGSHLRAPFIQSARAKAIRVEPLGTAPPFETDGEPLKAALTAFNVRPGALRIVF